MPEPATPSSVLGLPPSEKEVTAQHSPQHNTKESQDDPTKTPSSGEGDLPVTSSNTLDNIPPPLKALSWLDRLLPLWIFLAMLIGILLGNFAPDVAPALHRGTFVGVSVPIAVGLLVMMYPILCKVQFERLHEVFRGRKFFVQLGFSVVVNWIFGPLLMLGLAWAFLPDEQHLRQGLILVGIARCIAMVLIWNGLAGGSTDYCAVLVAVNSLLQILLYGPLSILYLQILTPTPASVVVPYSTVATGVAVFLGIPLGAAVLTRVSIRSGWIFKGGKRFYDQKFLPTIAPLALLGLLFTILVLFASQGSRVIRQIVSVVRVAAPMTVYFGLAFGLTYYAALRLARTKVMMKTGCARRVGGCDVEDGDGGNASASAVGEMDGRVLAITQAFTAASNNFELAIAIAVAAFGPASDEALAATVGPLVEVPVLVGLVYVVRWLERRRK